MASITLYVCFFHLIIFLRRTQSRQDLTFALACFFFGLYDIFCVGLYNASSPESGVIWQFRQVFSLSFGAVAFLFFIVEYTQQKSRKIIYFITGCYVVCLGIGITSQGRFVWSEHPAIKHVRLPFGTEVTYYEMAPGPVVSILSLLSILIFGYAFMAGMKYYKSGNKKRALALIFSTGLFFIGVINDGFVAMGVYEFIYVMEYSFMAMILLMTMTLSDEILRASKMERALRKNEELYREFIEGIDDLVLKLDYRGTLLFANQSATRFLDLKPDLIPGKKFVDYIHPDDRKMTLDILNFNLSHEHRKLGLENRVIHSESGASRFLLWEIHPHFDDSGQVEFINAVGRDITDLKNTELALRNSENQLRRLQTYLTGIVDSMPSILIGLDQDCRITQWNKPTVKLTEITSENARLRYLTEIFPELSETISMVDEALKTRTPVTRRKKKNTGRLTGMYLDITVYPLQTKYNTGAVIRIDDITDRVRIEEMVVQSEKMLSVGGLAAGMAHEINNPLAGILQSMQVIRNRLTDDIPQNTEAARECGTQLSAITEYSRRRKILSLIESILESGKRATDIVYNMLSFSRVSESRFRKHQLPELMDKTLDLVSSDYNLKKKYDFRQITIHRHYDSDLPRVECDAGKIQQVFMNILRNGAQAMAESTDDESSPVFHIRINKRDESIQIEIEDNGPGIPEKIQHRIFEPFFSTKPTGLGTGLGLSVSYFIVVETHAGNLQMEPGDHRGSRFVVTLPVVQKATIT